MPWWAWIAVGAILLGSELAFVDAQFYLVFIGASALVVGFLDVVGWLRSDWLQWLLFALLAAVSMVGFRRRIYDRMRRGLPAVNLSPLGELVTLPADLPAGGSCRLELRGSSWNVQNGGRTALGAGAKARVVRVDGVTLVVHEEP